MQIRILGYRLGYGTFAALSFIVIVKSLAQKTSELFGSGCKTLRVNQIGKDRAPFDGH
jgi:hypothetical protein